MIFFLATALQNSTAAEPANATTPEIFKQFSDNVVKIEVVETGSAAKASIGTGFFANERGHIITNYHVISKLIHSPDRYRIEVTDQSGQTDQATVLGVDVVYDLAVLRGSRPAKGFLRLESKPVEQGTRLYSLGHPRDLGLTIVEGTYNGLLEAHALSESAFYRFAQSGHERRSDIDSCRQRRRSQRRHRRRADQLFGPSRARRRIASKEPQRSGIRPPASFLAEVGRQIHANQKRYLADMFAEDHTERCARSLFVTDQAGGVFSLLGRRATAQRHSLRCRHPRLLDGRLSFRFKRAVVGHRAFLSSTAFDRGAQSGAILHSLFRSISGRQRRDVRQRRGGDAVSLSDAQRASAQTGKLKAVLCARQYVKLPGLYDAVFRGATLGARNVGLVTTLSLSGASFENVQTADPALHGEHPMAPLGYIEVLDAQGSFGASSESNPFRSISAAPTPIDIVVDDPYVCPDACRPSSRTSRGRLIARDLDSVNGLHAAGGQQAGRELWTSTPVPNFASAAL